MAVSTAKKGVGNLNSQLNLFDANPCSRKIKVSGRLGTDVSRQASKTKLFSAMKKSRGARTVFTMKIRAVLKDLHLLQQV